MDKDVHNEKHSEGAILTLSLSAEVSPYLSDLGDMSLVKLSPGAISSIAGASENLSIRNLNKNVFDGGPLSGDLMLGVAHCPDRDNPYLLQFRQEADGTYAYDLYSLSSLNIGERVVQCRHLDSDFRAHCSRYLDEVLYVNGRNLMPEGRPIDISALPGRGCSSDFCDYMTGAVKAAKSKLAPK